MNWEQLLAQAGLVLLKEGVNFVFSRFKNKAEAEDAQEREEGEAQVIASQALEGASEQQMESQPSKMQWSKVATLYWLGNDLMWIQDMMYRGAVPTRVLQGVNHAMKYCNDLGFDEKSFPIQQLTICISILESLKGISEFTPELLVLLQQHYGTINQYITTTKWYLNALLEQQQPGFEKLRAL